MICRSPQAPSFASLITTPAGRHSKGYTRWNNVILSIVVWLCLAGAIAMLFLAFGLRQYKADQATVDGIHADAAVSAWPAFRRDEAIRQAKAYNEALARVGQPTLGQSPDPGGPGYRYLLDTGAGIMFRVEIPAIGVDLPVYHGIDTAALAKGVGHMPDSSLPVGGPSTRPIISAHNGLTGAKYFDDLPKVRKGDSVIIRTMGRSLYYRVESEKTVAPEDVEDFKIVPGRDLITLTTCTNGTASRLGVTAHRVPGALDDSSAHISLGISEGRLAAMLLAWLLSALIAWHRTWKEEPIMRHRKAEVESDEMNGASHLQRKAVR